MLSKPVLIYLLCWTQKKIFWWIWVIKQLLVHIDFDRRRKIYYGSHCWPATVWFSTSFKIAFMFSRRKKLIQGLNDGIHKTQWQNRQTDGRILFFNATTTKQREKNLTSINLLKDQLLKINTHLVLPDMKGKAGANMFQRVSWASLCTICTKDTVTGTNLLNSWPINIAKSFYSFYIIQIFETLKVIAVWKFHVRFSVFLYSSSFPIKMHVTDAKMQKIEPDPIFFLMDEVSEAACKRD